MSKRFLEQVNEHAQLFRDTNTGIAWVEDGSTGLGHSAHPNIDVSGSVTGMKNLGYWDKNDVIVRSHGFQYNTSKLVVTEKLDKIAAEHCMCDSCQQRRKASAQIENEERNYDRR